MTASTGAYAADAVVFAEPEPVEYVRVCDVYGAGFFYIPGTETCLKIGGYIRNDININPGFSGYWNRARFTPTFDARSETEWGTLRGYAEVEISANTGPGAAGAPLNLAHAFIEVQGASGTFRIGRTHSPYSRFLGYGVGPFTNDIGYGFNNTSEVSYTFNGGNGFSGIIALVENPARVGWGTNVEGGINFAQGWGSIGAIVGYDPVNGEWGAKGVARFRSGNGFSASLHVFYASANLPANPNTYRVAGFTPAAIAYQQNWSVAAGVGFQASPKVAFNAYLQWFDAPLRNGAWSVAANVAWTPVTNLLIRPEIRYTANGVGASAWDGVVRFQRSF